MSLKNLLVQPDRAKREFEFEGVTYTVFVREPSTREYDELISGKPNTEAVALLVYETEDAEKPFFTKEQVWDMPPRLTAQLVKLVEEVILGIAEKKS